MNWEQMRPLLVRHIQTFFQGHGYQETVWTLGPVEEQPHLRIACLAPGPKCASWVYATIGASEGEDDGGRLEFVLMAPQDDLRHVELVTMTAYYHRKRHLGLGHTFPIGEPWLRGSACNVMLVSLPYPFGPALEICRLPDGPVHFFWLLPITQAEREFKAKEGLEALERRFDACGLEYANPWRPSVI